MNKKNGEDSIAVIGMSGSFPMANSIEELWGNLKNKKDCISKFSKEELIESGISEGVLDLDSYVRSKGVLPNAECFDAKFFRYSEAEACKIDPQQRLFLEHAWLALENAGVNIDKLDKEVSMIAGQGHLSYQNHIVKKFDVQSPEGFQTLIGNEKDFISTRVAYKLGLKGMSYDVQSACSTSLLAVHLAVQNLRSKQSDIVLAGGVSVTVPLKSGYHYLKGSIASSNGKCSPFSQSANGTVFSNGVGIVVLKRLVDAIEDNDFIYATIEGSASNNDGSDKVGFTAPSITGQKNVILKAQSDAKIKSNQVSFVETHGTGTEMGDPIEFEALKQAFEENRSAEGTVCRLGALKSNLGHLDASAGIAGFMKTVLALHHKEIPATINFDQPSPNINFGDSPFCINTESISWNESERFAGVSSFGIGGTNVHMILKNYDQACDGSIINYEKTNLFCFSAKTEESLHDQIKKFSGFINNKKDEDLLEISLALMNRPFFNLRRSFVANSREHLIEQLEQSVIDISKSDKRNKKICFSFPGQGTSYQGMVVDLYNENIQFRDILDHNLSKLTFVDSNDVRAVLLERDSEVNSELLKKTSIVQPAIFIVELSYAELLMKAGVKPTKLVGYSLGEYTAACISKVLSFTDALYLVEKRAELMERTEPGLMLSVFNDNKKSKLSKLEFVDVAISNPDHTIYAGDEARILDLEKECLEMGVAYNKVNTQYGFHSYLMDPILNDFETVLKNVETHPATIPYFSNFYGREIKKGETLDKSYWVSHLRKTVKFDQNIAELCQNNYVNIEIGPGRTISSILKKYKPEIDTIYTLKKEENSKDSFLNTVSVLWQKGVKIDLTGVLNLKGAAKIPVPGYSFSKTPYWYGNNAESISQLDKNETIIDVEEDSDSTVIDVDEDSDSTVSMIWKSNLGISSIKDTDDFFDLGGDSLLAIQTVSEINKKLSVDLSHHCILENPILSDFVKLTEQSDTDADNKLVNDTELLINISKENNKNTLFLIHPAGGTVFLYKELSKHLKRGVVGIQSMKMYDSEEVPSSIEEMCTIYLNQIQKHKPNGPYLLGGLSLGGVLAFEVAQQLKAKGESVECVFMMDSFGPGENDSHTWTSDKIKHYVKVVAPLAYDQMEKLPNPYNDSLTQLDNFALNYTQHMQLLNLNYQSKPYDGKVIYFRGIERDDFSHHHPEKSWLTKVIDLTVYNTKGNHVTLIEGQNGSDIAKLIEKELS